MACQEELLQAKDENTRLNTYLDQILAEIEQRAPGLRKQREDHDRAVDAVATLTSQLEEARQELNFGSREAKEAKRNAGIVQRENGRLLLQVKDLSRQVRLLCC